MRFHSRSLSLKFAKGVKRPDKSNAIDMLCSGQVPPRSQFETEDYERNFEEVPQPFTEDERREWLGKLSGVAVSSDAFVSTLLFPLQVRCL
jgi:phosphoribosylaminoimidazolecarboxamide formyltransferase / IMP cyclohydrolase